ncbi:NAD-dependent epimerase/dehydratase family protein [Pseudalkalibacillus hwajinpoensis]|uniref:NAD-dependent epimerase/dehydratase family protein n=1 Tax=Guptibacillus hwajinpoensis TaxID=208199 RepID=A0A4U1MJZ5_9BACL|nr:NAD-dependent epimerase/dehydratase family protein [Pseudalkalibacillus hwajinpoensis]TKD70730.1 NAD-dependent epimerase/dehydratase family protein [Pseudalkalibacillus hwajinpoensis]
MKTILITGVNSYIGTSLESWLENYPDQYSVDCISLRTDDWKKSDFSKYDVIFHVAGIAHVSSDPKMEELYYKVNRDLTIAVAEKSKAEGVKQFIFMSSIIVYGDGSISKKVIDKNTKPIPSNFYGNSKLLAEEGIKKLDNYGFKVVILRPPMIFGKGAKGNYLKLAKVAKIFPVFPDINNQRSMIHVDNLCEFVRLMIDNGESGLFFPQNKEYVKTSEMVRLIAKSHNRNIVLTKFFNPVVKIGLRKSSVINKVFGNLIYDNKLSLYKENYIIRDLEDSINVTEK